MEDKKGNNEVVRKLNSLKSGEKFEYHSGMLAFDANNDRAVALARDTAMMLYKSKHITLSQIKNGNNDYSYIAKGV